MVAMQSLLRESDFVTLHSPLTPETLNLVSAAELEMMKPEAFLINAARGPLIDEDALYDAVTSGKIAGAGLDVMVDAVPSPDHPLLKLENVLITPHVAFFSPGGDTRARAAGGGRGRERAARAACRTTSSTQRCCPTPIRDTGFRRTRAAWTARVTSMQFPPRRHLAPA